MTVTIANAITGGLSKTSKMPGPSYGLPATSCITGSKLRKNKRSVCAHCYACKGRYLFSNVKNALGRREAAIWHLNNTEQEVEDALVFLINKQAKASGYFRWHDTGDLQHIDHLNLILRVVDRTPTIRHFLPTKERRFIKDLISLPGNINIRCSAYLLNKTDKSPNVLVTRSAVYKDNFPAGAYICPGVKNKTCGECRACWDKNVDLVVYPQH